MRPSIRRATRARRRPRWTTIALALWTLALALWALTVAVTAGCGGLDAVARSECRFERSSELAGLALIWFIGFVPLAVSWLVGWARPSRCRLCGDEVRSRRRAVCPRCMERLVERAEPQ